MMKRTGKFYRKNEAEVMESLGLKPTPNSGSGWITKEDGQSEDLICQLKSTDAQSIKINQKDLRILEYNATVAHKIPLFAIQFLNTDEVWLLLKPKDIFEISESIKGNTIERSNDILDINSDVEDVKPQKINKIKSSANARLEYQQEQQQKYDKTKYAK